MPQVNAVTRSVPRSRVPQEQPALGSLGLADGAAVTPMCGREAINSSPLMA